jgi:hypothetical protein
VARPEPAPASFDRTVSTLHELRDVREVRDVVQESAAARVAPVGRASRGAARDDVWTALARCESGMRNDGGGPYFGYFQFSAGTWRSLGYDGLPHQHDYATQLAAAQRLQARSGWGQWPACSRRIGLR